MCHYLYNEAVIVIGRSEEHQPAGTEKYYSVQEYTLDEIAAFLGSTSNIIIDLSYTSVSNTNILDPGKEFSDNLNLIVDNLRFARNVKTGKYIYISSGGTVYGKTNDEHINELHATDPISNYGVTKLASEKYVSMFCSLNKISFNILRPSNVYGPWQIPFRGQGIVATALGAAYNNSPVKIYGKGDNIRDYVFIDDFLQWLMAVIDRGENGEIYNAGSGKGYSIADILSIIQEVLAGEHQLNLQYLSERPFDVKRNVLDNKKIIAATGIAVSTGLEDGIKKTWDWIKAFMAVKKLEAELSK